MRVCSLAILFIAGLVCVLGGTADEFREIDGTGNNLANDLYGSNDQPLMRIGGTRYQADGFSIVDGLPSARAVSNAMNAHTLSANQPNPRDVSDFLTYWGQWVDHDIDHSPTNGCDFPANIPVPSGDRHFDPTGDGNVEMPFCRTPPLFFGNSTNPRTIANLITAWIDASGIYGNTPEERDALREGSGGRMLVRDLSNGDFGPINSNGLGDVLVPMGNSAGRVSNTELRAYGDARGNENAFLHALHVLWLREHNRIADSLDNDMSDDEKWAVARRWVAAFNQRITYFEYLPALFGRDFPEADDYDPDVNPNIDAFFSTASFRYGHSEVNNVLLRLDEDYRQIEPYGNLPLRHSYFLPEVMEEGGIEPLFRGAVANHQQQVDSTVVDALRNELFGFSSDQTAGFPALDLISINIQRGRDHGVPSYTTMRNAFGLSVPVTFDGFISDDEISDNMFDVYGGDIDAVDAFVGGLLEDHVSGSNLGALFEASLLDQFTRIRDGDRFYYEWDEFFDDDDIDEIENTLLSDIIKRNTDIDGQLDDLPDDVFVRFDIREINDCSSASSLSPFSWF